MQMTTSSVTNKISEQATIQFANKWKLVEKKLQEQAETMKTLLDSLQSLSLSTTYSENIAKMVSSITHEVRNPLTSVSGFLQLIKQTNDIALIHQYTDIALGELTRANDLITDFLTLSKSQSNEITPLSINELLINLYPVFKSEANLKDINLIADFCADKALCTVNRQHLTQIFVNIVKNAFEATETNLLSRQKEVRITTTVCKESLVIMIKDSGFGMSKTQLKNLFTPLQTTKKNGTGMGLYVCKQLIEKYAGTVKVESTVDKGTTIFIHFPIYVAIN